MVKKNKFFVTDVFLSRKGYLICGYVNSGFIELGMFCNIDNKIRQIISIRDFNGKNKLYSLVRSNQKIMIELNNNKDSYMEGLVGQEIEFFEDFF